ncbi:serine/threonine-protein kinase pim-2-like [Mya arenaria]|uniref:serine/threonine-protein kinase pim-2-like n=1 Tax=Mya arenaria TaxID=6604 RepID=UPI0022E5E713|nr:serine/threonine-protein kinase pim-2-like [Mya arenaria]XP_052792240.1 serine/threonine-protein kinase pim-2-like [Mya arenaria]
MSSLFTRISKGHFLGKGGNGKVFEAHSKNGDKQLVVKQGRWWSQHCETPPEIANTCLMQQMGVRGINHMVDCEIYHDKTKNGASNYSVVFERMPMDLFTYVEKFDIPEPVVKDIMWQIIVILCEMDSKCQLMHMDMKPENVLIDPDTIEVRLCDLEFCVPTDDECISLKSYEVSTPAYRAPERQFKVCFPRKSTVWSLGIMAYEMLHDDVPWESYVIEKGAALKFGTNVSEQYINFVLACLEPIPSERPEVSALLQHQWLCD